MPTKIFIPTPLRQYVGNQEWVEVEARTVGEALNNLISKYGMLKRYLLDEKGRLRNYVNVYVNEEDIRYQEGLETPVKEGDRLLIVPAVAGGSFRALPTTLVRGDLSREELRKYGRHLIIPEVGLEGQRKLKASSVLVVGAGGLGNPVSIYLAAAGVGRIGIVDFDVVDSSNLQRQTMFSEEDVGRKKVEALKERLEAFNPHVEVIPHDLKLTSENALDVLKDYDVIVDGTDNFPTRYLINDACVLLAKANVYGSIFRFEGQLSVFDARRGPCYRCLYPEPPPPGLVPSCAEGGVLGVLPGTIGTLQATEALKLLLGKGRPLIGQLLLYDALNMEFRTLKLRKDPKCPACGENPTIKELIDYEEFCGLRRGEVQALEASWEIEPEELKARLDKGEHVIILDVREPVEYEICRIAGSTLIPLRELPSRVGELSLTDEIVVHCHTGERSAMATSFLRQLGFRRVKNLKGGIDAWAEKVDPDMPRY